MRDVINNLIASHPVGAPSKRQREPMAEGFRSGASWGQHERQNGSAAHFSVGVLVPVSKWALRGYEFVRKLCREGPFRRPWSQVRLVQPRQTLCRVLRPPALYMGPMLPPLMVHALVVAEACHACPDSCSASRWSPFISAQDRSDSNQRVKDTQSMGTALK